MKQPLLPGPVQEQRQARSKKKLFYTITAFGLLGYAYTRTQSGASLPDLNSLCVQEAPLLPKPNAALDANLAFIDSAKDKLAAKLSGLVQIPSESYDVMGPVGEDSRWDVFYKVEDYLKKEFPVVHEHLEIHHANTHGLIYIWKGSNADLKPVMFMAHQDVVPVNPDTVSDWTYPPYSGHYDGELIWGRGSSDCKLDLIARMVALDLLIKSGFEPKRSIIVAFGFDEESAGLNGAGQISKYLQNLLGQQSVAAIFDEGSGFEEYDNGLLFAIPSVAEKGYMDANVSFRVTGGHSSVPHSRHTGIGILSKFVTEIENANDIQPHLSESSVVLELVQCLSKHVPQYKPLQGLVRAASIVGSKGNGARAHLAHKLATYGLWEKALVQTSQAIDIFHAGFKVNALPESGWLDINYRISDSSSVKEITDYVAKYASKVAREFNISFINTKDPSSFATAGNPPDAIILSSFGDLEPAPITPLDSPVYSLFQGIVKHVVDPNVIVAPLLSIGNTDTQFMWNLTRHIYRFSPHKYSSGHAHSVDESSSASDLQLSTKFVHETIRLFDSASI